MLAITPSGIPGMTIVDGRALKLDGCHRLLSRRADREKQGDR